MTGGTSQEKSFGCNYNGDAHSGNTLYEGTFLENATDPLSSGHTYQSTFSGITATSVLGSSCDPKPSVFCNDINDPWLYGFL